MRTTTMILAVLSCGLSAYLTIRWCSQINTATGFEAATVAVVMGLVWELAKYVFAWQGRWLITSILVAGSIMASLAWMADTDSRVGEQHRMADHSIKTADLLLSIAERDAAKGYRARALESISQATSLAATYRPPPGRWSATGRYIAYGVVALVLEAVAIMAIAGLRQASPSTRPTAPSEARAGGAESIRAMARRLGISRHRAKSLMGVGA